MKKVMFFAAAAAAATLVASPALARDTMQPRAGVHAKTYKSKHMMKHQARAYRGDRQARAFHTDEMTSRDDWNNRGTGFWPADVVGGAVGAAGAIAGAAVGTAGAIATAPFGGPAHDRYAYRDTYAYDGGPGYAEAYTYNGVAIPYSSNYAARNGFVCQPGTFIRGTRTLCQ